MKEIISYIILLSLFSCNREIYKITVDVAETTDVQISDIALTHSIIPLQTPDSLIVSSVEQIRKTNEYIFINEGKQILQFDSSGNFIRAIIPPDEQWLFFDIDSLNRKLLVSSWNDILCYNFDGQLINALHVDLQVRGIFSLKDGYCFLGTRIGTKINQRKHGNITHLYKLDDQLNIRDSIVVQSITYKKKPKSEGGFGLFPISETNSGSFFYLPTILDDSKERFIIWQLEDNSLQPFAKISIVKYRLGNSRKEEDGYLNTIEQVFCTDRYVFIKYSFERRIKFILYDQKNQQTYNLNDGFIGDFLNTGKVWINPINTESGEIYYVIDGPLPQRTEDNIYSNSNKIIVLVKLKN